MRLVPSGIATLLAVGMTACGTVPDAPRAPATWDDVQALPAASVGQRIAYGRAAKQFGDLRLPSGPGPHPVAILLHGGCWQAEYDLAYMAHLGDTLARAGIATWSLEYRGIGDAGGGWPGTFEDVDAGAAHLRSLAATHALDLDRVVLVGHSAGGHLALWLAARKRPSGIAAPLAVRGVVPLAAIADLREYGAASGSCNRSVGPLLGGTPAQVPERYAAASPSELLPIGVPVRMLVGALDPIVPPAHDERFATAARARGDDVELVVIEGAGHFDLVMPTGPAAERVQGEIRGLLSIEPRE